MHFVIEHPIDPARFSDKYSKFDIDQYVVL
jgi:hypothetical protein